MPDKQCYKNEFFQKIIDEIDNLKDKRAKKILYERYFSGNGRKLKTWKEIAPLVDLSVQGCINIHNSVIKKIRHKVRAQFISSLKKRGNHLFRCNIHDLNEIDAERIIRFTQKAKKENRKQVGAK